jgi:hypothetical protein
MIYRNVWIFNGKLEILAKDKAGDKKTGKKFLANLRIGK